MGHTMGKTRLGGLKGGLWSRADQGRLGRVTRLAMKPYQTNTTEHSSEVRVSDVDK